jgi:hypothetical protein
MVSHHFLIKKAGRFSFNGFSFGREKQKIVIKMTDRLALNGLSFFIDIKGFLFDITIKITKN